jgi:ribose transport system substrate-binding protein
MNDPGYQYEYTFVLVPKVGDNPFAGKMYSGCEKQAFNIGSMLIRCVYLPPSRANATEQAALIRDVATYPDTYGIFKKVDGMMISVLDEKVTGEAIDYVVTVRNISVITLDSDAPNSTRAAYVGANNSDLGVQIGKELSLMSPKKKEASMQL